MEVKTKIHQKSGPVNVKDLGGCPGATCWWWGGGGWGWSSGRTRAGWCHTCSPPRPRSPTPPAQSGWGSVWGSVSIESNRRVTIVTSVCWTPGRPALKTPIVTTGIAPPPITHPAVSGWGWCCPPSSPPRSSSAPTPTSTWRWHSV